MHKQYKLTIEEINQIANLYARNLTGERLNMGGPVDKNLSNYLKHYNEAKEYLLEIYNPKATD